MGGVVVPPILDSFFQVCFLGEFRSIFVNEDEKAPQKKPADVRHVKVHQEIDFGSFVFGGSRSGSFIYIRRSQTTASPPAVPAELFHVLKICKPKHTPLALKVPSGVCCFGSSHSQVPIATLANIVI